MGSGCGSDAAEALPARATGVDVEDGVVGKVEFEKRPMVGFGVLGGKSSVVRRPARHVRVDVLRADGKLIATTVTDAEGRYGVAGAMPEGYRVLAFAESPADVEPFIPVRVLDRSGSDYAVSSQPQSRVREGDKSVVDLVASVDSSNRVAGAFNIVDAMQTSAKIWVAKTGIRPAPAIVRWQSGGTEQPGTFFQRGTNEISITGGLGSVQDSTDTDEFDDAVISHEYWHFLQSNHAFSSSPGGPHSTEPIVPLLAFEEAFGDWFGVFSHGSSLYEDSIGNEDGKPMCGFCDDLERSMWRTSKGIASEQSIYEILWDLADGHEGQPDSTDPEFVTVDAGALLEAILAFHPQKDVFELGTFLEKLLDTGAVTEAEVRSILTAPIDHDVTFPPLDRDVPSTGRDLFPIPLVPGSVVQGEVDATQRLSGAHANVERGFHSIRYYALRLDAPRRVTITLRIEGTGQTPEDLDLRLLTPDQRVLAVSDSSTPVETITRDLASGTYLVAVFGFFLDNRGNAIANRGRFTLEVD
ncbi:MAG TPA: hypothetical protein VK116_02655 [Planctomycetota bacterium]|nr:hypothetical protein [Planctomycetota bacterium]